MLVKESIVKSWYQRNSWVYQQFSYLFQNPLWDKDVPNGFSVCPYFWLSLFSFFIFRPLVVIPIFYIIRPLIKLGGRPLYLIDRGIGNLFNKVFSKSKPCDNAGSGTLLLVIISISVSAAALIIYYLGNAIIHLYSTLQYETLGRFIFWVTSIFIGMLLTIVLHKKITQSECKTMNYLYVYIVGVILAAALFIPTEALSMLNSFYMGVCTNCAWLWNQACNILEGVWYGIVVLFELLWSAFLWQPVKALLLPWWGYLIASGIAVYGFDKLIDIRTLKQIEQLKTKTDRKSFNTICRNRWKEIIYSVLTSNKYYRSAKLFDGLIYRNPNEEAFSVHTFNLAFTAFLIHHKEITLRAIEKYWRKDLNTLEKTYPIINFKIKPSEECVEEILSAFCKKAGINELEMDEWAFIACLNDIYRLPEIQTLIFKTIDDLKKSESEALKSKELKKQSWSHQMCLKWTTTIGNVVSGIGKNIGVFCVYIWMLIKAKKQGACPYFRFEDPKK